MSRNNGKARKAERRVSAAARQGAFDEWAEANHHRCQGCEICDPAEVDYAYVRAAVAMILGGTR